MLKNAGQLLTERARLSPGLDVVIDTQTGSRLTYSNLNDSVNRICTYLRSELSIECGMRVGILLPNGAISVMLNAG